MLHTADAHGLYEAAGFAAPDGTFLERPARRAGLREAAETGGSTRPTDDLSH
jgi:hypothetical protein